MKKIFFGLFVLLLIFVIVQIVNADDTGFISPDSEGLVYSDYGTPTNAYTQSDTYSIGTALQDEQDFYGFDFTFVGSVYSIDGIIVEAECINTKNPTASSDVKLTWNGGSSWSNAKSCSVTSSDIDYYQVLGSSTDLWGRTWSVDDFDDGDFAVFFNVTLYGISIDHVRVKIYYTATSLPTGFGSGEHSSYAYNCTCLNLSYNSSLSTNWYNVGWRCCSSILASDFLTTDYFNNTNGVEYISLWNPKVQAYTELWFVSAPPTFDFTIYTGESIWINVIGNVTLCFPICEEYNITLYEDIVNASGEHEYILNDTGYHVWANYSSAIMLYEDIVNATGTHEYIYSEFMQYYKVWANYTGNESILSCELKYLNYTDGNITFNITYWGCNTTNTSNYTINDGNWLNIAGLEIDDDTALLILWISLIFMLLKLSRTYKGVPLMLGGTQLLLLGIAYTNGYFPGIIEIWLFLGACFLIFSIYKTYKGWKPE